MMKTILVDDEILLLERFEIECSGMDDINIIGKFSNPYDAISYTEQNQVDLAFVDIMMPQMDGVTLAHKLKEIYPEMIIIYLSAHEKYMPEAFRSLTADYFILKPYRQADVRAALDKAKLLSARLKKPIFIHTFGRFKVFLNGEPLSLSGKAKEILALLVSKRGKEISNEEIYATIWEGRQYSNVDMKVYHNALKRLRQTLEEYGIDQLLISTGRAQMVNTAMFDCDYYQFLNGELEGDVFDEHFLSEYSWGEYMIAEIRKLRGDEECEHALIYFRNK